MKATFKLFGGLKEGIEIEKNAQGDIIFEFYTPTTLDEVIHSLKLNKKPFLVVKNGIIVNDLKIPINDGDEISLFPPIAGGSIR